MILAVYSLTTLFTKGEIFGHVRGLVQAGYQRACDFPPLSWLRVDPDYPVTECSLCVGFWVAFALAVVPMPMPILTMFAVHGGAFFLRSLA